MKKTVWIILLFITNSVSLQAQHGAELFSDAMKAFQNREYTRAFLLYEKFMESHQFKDELYASAVMNSSEALMNLGRFEAALPRYEYLINNFYFTPLRDRALYFSGILFFQLGEYSKSRTNFMKLLAEFPDSRYYGNGLYWAGQCYVKQEKFEDAVHFLENAVDNRKNAYQDYAVYSLAEAYEKMGEYKKAVENYDRLLTYYPESLLAPYGMIRIGICYFYLGEYDMSILELSNPLVEGMSGDHQAEASYLLANSYYRIGEYASAEEHYRSILGEYPGSAVEREVQFALAWSLFQQDDYPGAYSLFDNLSDGYDSLAVRSSYWRAEALRYMGDENGALKQFNSFLLHHTNHPLAANVHFKIGVINFNKREFQTAKIALLQAINTTNSVTQAMAYTLLAEIELRVQKFLIAKKYYQEAVNVSYPEEDTYNRAMLGLGISNFYLDRYDLAISTLQTIEKTSPSFEPDKVAFYLAESYLGIHDYQKALEYYRAIDSDEVDNDDDILYGMGISAYNQGDYQTALYQFADFIRFNPNDSRTEKATILLANSYLADKNYEAAARAYADAINANPKENADELRYHYALSLLNSGRSKDAIDQLRKLLNFYPKSSYRDNAKYLIGWIHFKDDNYELAIDSYNYALQSGVNEQMIPLIFYSIGDCYYNLGEYKKSIDQYYMIVDTYPNSQFVYDALNGIQYSYFALGRTDRAIRLIDNYVNNNMGKSFADALFLKKGELYYSMGEYRKAADAYEEFISYFPNSQYIPDAYYWRGKSYKNRDRYNEALTNFSAVYSSYTNNKLAAASVIEMSDIYAREEEYSAGVSLLTEAIKTLTRSESLPEMYYLKGRIQEMSGDIGAAYDTYLELLGYFRVHMFADKARLALGNIEINAKRYDKAEEYFQQIVDRKTDEYGAEAQYFLGYLAYEQASYMKAIEEYQKVLDNYNTYDEWVTRAYLGLGDAYAEAGEIEKAKDAYRIVLSKHRSDEFGREARKKLRRL